MSDLTVPQELRELTKGAEIAATALNVAVDSLLHIARLDPDSEQGRAAEDCLGRIRLALHEYVQPTLHLVPEDRLDQLTGSTRR